MTIVLESEDQINGPPSLFHLLTIYLLRISDFLYIQYPVADSIDYILEIAFDIFL